MNFYTNVTRYGNMILYRGYENGKKVSHKIKYAPTLFVSSPKGDWSSLTGEKCAPLDSTQCAMLKNGFNKTKKLPVVRSLATPDIFHLSLMNTFQE